MAKVKANAKALKEAEALDETQATHGAPIVVAPLAQPNYVTLEQVQQMLQANGACKREKMVVLANFLYSLPQIQEIQK